jgi:hypothetical protein
MNWKAIILCGQLGALSAQAQAFRDLAFEAANLPPVPSGALGGYVPISSAMPGWSGAISGPTGVTQQTEVLQNNFLNGTATIGILGPDWGQSDESLFGLYGLGVIDGSYTVVLESGAYTTGAGYNTSIAEVGTVPANAQSLQFKAWQIFLGTFSVSFDGNDLNVVLLSTGVTPTGQPYEVYGADIAPYASQTGQLEFAQNYSISDPKLLLDDIIFSQTAVVPEPSPLLLTGVGGLILATRRRFFRS